MKIQEASRDFTYEGIMFPSSEASYFKRKPKNDKGLRFWTRKHNQMRVGHVIEIPCT